VLHATNIDYMNNAAQITAQRLREIGVNVQLATSDWGGVVTRRAVKTAPDQGGWNIFITSAGGNSVGNPIALTGHAAIGEKGWFGWPADETHESCATNGLRPRPSRTRRPVARELQKNAWDFVPHVFLGQWVAPVAYRANIRGVLAVPEIVPFWNIEKA
jgi:peptide/nickel transport system substrate-binding protein